ncbi:MAG: prepilin-type N-terminal cleavage/methylation domain-containing protein [Lentisphaeria bacterium]|nr:prepilin-type N-terminal cleavage/methylation domain-containing protein [Lentisphaeria bacterium]
MKTSSKRSTLIELLVVIAIIGILAGLVFPALGVVRNNAKKSKASSECQSLKTAIIMYESEFSCWPAKVSGSTDALVGSSEYVDMCDRLTGNNSKKMVFYEVGVGYKEGDGILDPWGRPYQVILDVNFDDRIDNKVKAVSAVNSVNGRTGQDLRTRVAVYSFGVDEKDKEATNVDKLASRKKLVISW